MNLLEIFAQVGEGMGHSVLIFVLTLVFSLPLGLLVAYEPLGAACRPEKEQLSHLAENSGISSGMPDIQSIYLCPARDAADAAVDGGVLWPLLHL